MPTKVRVMLVRRHHPQQPNQLYLGDQHFKHIMLLLVQVAAVGMMALMEDTDGIVDYDDVVYEDRQPLFVDGTLSSMEEFPKEKQYDKTTSLHILAGLGSGKSIEAEKTTVLDPSHPETSDLEASDGGESSGSSAGDQKQVLLFFL